jgi:hypothetical protein
MKRGLFLKMELRMCLHTSGGFRKTRHLTGSLSGSGGEQLIDVFQFEAGNLGEHADHGGDTVFS